MKKKSYFVAKFEHLLWIYEKNNNNNVHSWHKLLEFGKNFFLVV